MLPKRLSTVVAAKKLVNKGSLILRLQQILSKLYLDINQKLNAIENEICNNAYFYETLSLKINWDLHKLLLRRKKTRSLSASIKKSCDNRKDT